MLAGLDAGLHAAIRAVGVVVRDHNGVKRPDFGSDGALDDKTKQRQK